VISKHWFWLALPNVFEIQADCPQQQQQQQQAAARSNSNSSTTLAAAQGF